MTLYLFLQILGYLVAFGTAIYLEQYITGEITLKHFIVAILLAPLGWWMLWATLVIVIEKNTDRQFLNKRLW